MDTDAAQQEVARLAQAWAAAEQGGDVAFLERTLADDFLAVGPLGFLLGKREWIGRHLAGDLTYDALALDEVSVRVYDAAAVLVGRLVQDAAYRGASIDMRQLRSTLLFVRQGERWRLAGIQMSAIARPPALAQQEGA